VLKIRMKRAGGRNHPFYRVVVIDSRRARDSRAVEELGYYNPLETPLVINVNRERVAHWVEKGAQLSDSVRTLLKRENSLHPTRRNPEAFEAAVPEEKPAPRAKKSKAAKVESAVAVAEAEAEEAVAPEAPAPEKTPDGDATPPSGDAE
jgi:small subunit ribosomal protein S16